MSPEKFQSEKNEIARGGAFENIVETGADVKARLFEAGWTEGEIGKFGVAIQKMADFMADTDKENPGRKISIDLALISSPDGNDTAEVTLLGESGSPPVDPTVFSELMEKNEFPIELAAETTMHFFANENKVILSRKRNPPPQVDIM